MAQRAIIIGLLISLLCSPTAVHANTGKAIKAVLEILTGAAAAKSLGNSAHAYEKYKTEDEILKRLKEQMVDGSNDAIYSIYFKTNGATWSDFWSYPDVFFYVDIEGKGSFLVPQIHEGYRGTPILGRVLAEEVAPGTRIIVRVMDDDSTSDAIWNSILKSRITLQASDTLSVTRFLPVSVAASGEFQFLDRRATMDAPDFMAYAEFVVPETEDGVWLVDGKLYDSDHQSIGTIQIASVWSAKKQIAKQSNTVSSWFGSTVFWGVLGGCLLLLFIAQVIQDLRKTSK